jgi:hypothetical protein
MKLREEAEEIDITGGSLSKELIILESWKKGL